MTDTRCKHELILRDCADCNPPEEVFVGRCSACGRPLTDELSQWVGMGPQCFVMYENLRRDTVKRIWEILDGGDAAKWGPLPDDSRVGNWQRSFSQLDGIIAAVHTKPDGIYLHVGKLPT